MGLGVRCYSFCAYPAWGSAPEKQLLTSTTVVRNAVFTQYYTPLSNFSSLVHKAKSVMGIHTEVLRRLQSKGLKYISWHYTESLADNSFTVHLLYTQSLNMDFRQHSGQDSAFHWVRQRLLHGLGGKAPYNWRVFAQQHSMLYVYLHV